MTLGTSRCDDVGFCLKVESTTLMSRSFRRSGSVRTKHDEGHRRDAVAFRVLVPIPRKSSGGFHPFVALVWGWTASRGLGISICRIPQNPASAPLAGRTPQRSRRHHRLHAERHAGGVVLRNLVTSRPFGCQFLDPGIMIESCLLYTSP